MTPDQLKNSILQLAIQGKLVEQRSKEGTAEELYKQIQVEKAELIKQGKIKKEKPLPPIKEEEIPFDIPETWKWARWGDLSYSIQYGYNAPAQEKGDIKMVRISDIQNGNIIWETVPYCNISKEEIPTYLLKKNDILFARTGGTVGKSYLVKNTPENAIYAGYLIRTRFNNELLCSEYLKFFMESNLYWIQLREGTIATAQPNCNGKTLSKMIIPLPPLAEQHRIVAKIEELLPMVEKYGEAYNKLEALNKNFPAEIKKSILQYAIQGKLTEEFRAQSIERRRKTPSVELSLASSPNSFTNFGGASLENTPKRALFKTCPQSTDLGEVSRSDERGLMDLSAEELLKQIQAEKAELIKQGKIKKDKNESTIIKRGNSYFEKVGTTEKCIDDELPFEIPDSWRWAKLGNISSYGYSKQKQNALNADKNTWCLELEDIEKGGKLLEKKKIADKKAVGDKTIFFKGDILYSKLRPYLLKILVADDNGICTPEIVPFKAFGNINHNYLVNYLKSPFVDSLVNSQTYGMKMPRAGAETLLNLLVPLPTLAEQHRIVAKIEELFSFVDKLQK